MSEVQIGDCRLILGDCRDVLPGLRGIDCIVSDPPYGIAFQKGEGGASPNGRRFRARNLNPIEGDAKPFDPSHLMEWPCVLFGANHFYARLLDGGTFHVWDKTRGGFGPDDSFSDVEFFWTSWRCSSEIVRHLWKGVCRDSESHEPKYHISQKPVAVMEALVRLTSGFVVADPYMGSGSTGIACVRLGRPFIGIEIDEQHFADACRRIERAYAQGDMFREQPAKPEQLKLESA